MLVEVYDLVVERREEDGRPAPEHTEVSASLRALKAKGYVREVSLQSPSGGIQTRGSKMRRPPKGYRAACDAEETLMAQVKILFSIHSPLEIRQALKDFFACRRVSDNWC